MTLDTLNKHPALFFFDGQYLLRWREGEQARFKFIAPADVRAAFAHESIDTGWTPPGLRRWGLGPRGEWLAVFLPPALCRLRLAHPDEERSVEIEAPLPPLVFAGGGHNYYVWAIKEKDFRPDAPAYHAPLPNVHDNGLTCFGQNRAPLASCRAIGNARQTFFQGVFNAHLAADKSRRYPDDARAQLLELAERRARRYPLSDLLPHEATVEQMLNRTLLHETVG